MKSKKPLRCFQLTANHKLLLSVTEDGTIIPGPGFTTVDEMSLAFWAALKGQMKEKQQ